jgi:hypothetical protein
MSSSSSSESAAPLAGVVSPRVKMTFIQEALSRTSETNDFLFGSGTGGPETKNDQFDKAMLAHMETMRSAISEQHVFNLADAVPFFREGAESIVSDNFNRCFSVSQEPAWNWNFYLAPIWLLGVIVRYLILLPLRVAFILTCSCLFILGCEILHLLPMSAASKSAALRFAVQKYPARPLRFTSPSTLPRSSQQSTPLVRSPLRRRYCAAFVSSWSGVVKCNTPPFPHGSFVTLYSDTTVFVPRGRLDRSSWRITRA